MNETDKEEWQNPDNEYLNCIGVGDTYIKKQIERILNNNLMDCSATFMGRVACYGEEKHGNK